MRSEFGFFSSRLSVDAHTLWKLELGVPSLVIFSKLRFRIEIVYLFVRSICVLLREENHFLILEFQYTYSEGGLLTLNTKNYKTLLLRGMYWCKKKKPKISLNKIKLWIYSTLEKNHKNNPVYKITIFWQDFQGNFLYICWKLGDLNMITYWLGRTTTLQQTTPKLWTFLKNSQSGLKSDERRLKIIFSGF